MSAAIETTSAARERPIIFSAPMVCALLAGHKTQTRRVVKPQPNVRNEAFVRFPKPGAFYVCWDAFPTGDAVKRVIAHCEKPGTVRYMGQAQFVESHCPYGKPGDRLWVRESWRPWWDKELYCVVQYRDGTVMKPEIHDEDIGHGFAQRCDGAPDSRWCSPIHMPRWGSRITLEIADVRVERVQDVGEEDAIAEGIAVVSRGHRYHPDAFKATPDSNWQPTAKDAYRELWDSINGKSNPWASNCWIWVISFEKVGA